MRFPPSAAMIVQATFPMHVVGVLIKSSIASMLIAIPRTSRGQPTCANNADIAIAAAPGSPGVETVNTITENAREIIPDADISMPYILAAASVITENVTGKAALHIDVHRGIESEYIFLDIPMSSQHFMPSGIDAILEHVLKPVVISGRDFRNITSGLKPVVSFTATQ